MMALGKQVLDEMGRALNASGVVVRTLSLKGWRQPVDTALRALSLRTAEQVRALNLSGSLCERSCLNVVKARFWALRSVNVSECPFVDDDCIKSVIACSHATLTALDVSSCPALTIDCIGWLAGELGTGMEPSCKRLQSLRAGSNPQLDVRAWAFLRRHGLRTLRYLDLTQGAAVDDESVGHIAAGCPRLEVLDLRRCDSLTDDSLRHVGAHCHKLRSIGLTRLEWITDRGLWSLAHGCSGLQTVDVAGCYQITELGLYFLGVHCPGLQRLRADGDSLVTYRGLANLARGLGAGLVEVSSKWHGLKPSPGGPLLKLERQYDVLRNASAGTIQRQARAWIARRLTSKLRVQRTLRQLSSEAAAVAARNIRARAAEARRLRKAQMNAAVMLSVRGKRIVRRMRERRAAAARAVEREAAAVLDKIKARLRSQRARARERRVFEAVMLQRRCRREEAAAMAVLGMQNLLREYQAHSILGSLRWELFRRREDTTRAVVAVQCCWRCWVARQRVGARRAALVELLRAVQQLTAIVQRVWRGHVGRRHARWMRRFGRNVVVSCRYRRAAIIQAMWRGYVGRAYADMVAREKELLDNAVRRIQRVWRGSRVSTWQEIALKQVRRQLQVGRHKRLADGILAMARQHRRQIAARPDSASDEGSEDDWEATEDSEGRARWYSRARDATAERQPLWRLERQLAGARVPVRIFWPSERRDVQGRVARWVPLKQRFKVEYDDGRAEYLALHRDWKRCTVLWGGVWQSFAALPHEEWRPPGARRGAAGARGGPAGPRGVFALAAGVAADQAAREEVEGAPWEVEGAPWEAEGAPWEAEGATPLGGHDREAASGAVAPADLADDWFAEAQRAAAAQGLPEQGDGEMQDLWFGGNGAIGDGHSDGHWGGQGVDTSGEGSVT